MTELELQLSKSLSRLSTQYEADMKRLAGQNTHLQEQVQALAAQISDLVKRLDVQTQQVVTLTGAYKTLTAAWREEFK